MEVIDIQDEKGNTPLHHAVNGGSVECIKLLIEKGCKTNIFNKAGMAPLHVAVDYNKLKSTKVG